MDKAYIEANARRMHPDLDWPTPSEEVRRLVKRYDNADAMTEIAEFITHRDVEMPWLVSEYLNVTIKEWDDVKKDYVIDTEETRKRLALHLQLARRLKFNVEKEYDDAYFRLVITTPHGGRITVTADRSTLCERKVVGTEWIKPHTVEGHYKDIVEWDCEPIALSAIEV